MHKTSKICILSLALVLGGCGAPVPTSPAYVGQENALPPHAVSRLGTGVFERIALSADGTLLALQTSLGLQVYAADTFAPVWSASGGFSNTTFHPTEATLITQSDEHWGDVLFIDPRTGQVQDRLRIPCRALRMSPDGMRLACNPGVDGIDIWRVDRRREVRGLYPGDLKRDAGASSAGTRWFGPIPNWDVAWSPDGRFLASGIDGIDIWRVDRRKEVRGLYPVDLKRDAGASPAGTRWSGPIPNWDVAWSPDGRFLASGIADGRVVIWNVRMGRARRVLEGHPTWATGTSYSPGGDLLASHASDGQVIVWDVETGQRLETLQTTPGSKGGMAWSPDGRLLASAWGHGQVDVWTVATGDLYRSLQLHEGEAELDFAKDESGQGYSSNIYAGDMRGLAFSRDGAVLFAGSGTEVVAWEVATGRVVRKIEGNGRIVRMALSPDRQTLITGSDEGLVTVWDKASGQSLSRMEGYGDRITAIAYAPDGTLVATGDVAGRLILRDTQSWNPGATCRYSNVHSVSFSPDGSRLAVGVGDVTEERLVMLDVRDLGELGTKPATGWQTAWSPDGTLLATATRDGEITVLDVETLQVLKLWQHPCSSPWGLSWSPDGRRLFTESSLWARIYDVRTGRVLDERQFFVDGLVEYCSPDRTWLAFYPGEWMVSDYGYSIRVWDVKRDEVLYELEGHRAYAQIMGYDAVDAVLISGSDDGSVILWDMAGIGSP